MKIRVTKKECGLEVGKTYDLCDRAAKNLIVNGQAVLVGKEKTDAPKK